MKQDQFISDLEVEQLLLGELPEERARQLRERLETNQDGRINQIVASNQEILQSYPSAKMVEEIQQRLEKQGRKSSTSSQKHRSWLVWTGLPALASAAVLAIWLQVEPAEQEVVRALSPHHETGRSNVLSDAVPDAVHNQVRIKGLHPYLSVYRQKGGVTEKLQDRSMAASGDLLQLSYVAAGHRRGMVFSLDGAGVVTSHYPSGPNQSTQLQDGGEVPLSHAYELDAAPRFERFFLVTIQGDRSMDVDRVLSAARKLGKDPKHAEQQKLALPSYYYQFSIVLQKGS